MTSGIQRVFVSEDQKIFLDRSQLYGNNPPSWESEADSKSREVDAAFGFPVVSDQSVTAAAPCVTTKDILGQVSQDDACARTRTYVRSRANLFSPCVLNTEYFGGDALITCNLFRERVRSQDQEQKGGDAVLPVNVQLGTDLSMCHGLI